jgi:dihydroorotate dehydrogenase electron transfer subunit
MSESEARPTPVQENARILANEKLDGRLFLMTLAAPRIARSVLPGQFIHLRLPALADHILRRPFGVYDRDVQRGTIDVLYQVVGAGTAYMSGLPAGECCGPLGQGWSLFPEVRRALVVAGGAGAAPLYLFTAHMLAKDVEVDVVLGAQTKGALVMRERFSALMGHEPSCSTDDGSYGYHGFATGPAGELLAENSYDQVYCCGPEPMMRAVADLARQAQVGCQVSLEKRMACGVGACLSCIVETTEGRRRSCVDGPVFDAEKVVWA